VGLLWRVFAPRPLKKARRALHPSWVIEDAIVRNMRGGRKRRRRSAPQGWQGTGAAYTPDGRHVRFQCGHHHRTQAAMQECVRRRQRQIERGDNLQLVTRVLDTPESRQRAAERVEQQAKRQQELAAQKQTAAHQRAERQEAARRARLGQTDAQQEAAPQLAAQRRVRRAARPPMSWPGWGNLASGAAAFTGVVLVEVAGKDEHSPLAAVGALLLVVAVGAAALCVPVALWHKVQARKQAKIGLPGR
jgi:hypothetical protein